MIVLRPALMIRYDDLGGREHVGAVERVTVDGLPDLMNGYCQWLKPRIAEVEVFGPTGEVDYEGPIWAVHRVWPNNEFDWQRLCSAVGV